LHMETTCTRISSSISISFKNLVATISNASVGQSLNQSMVQQFTSDGNFRRRTRNASPTGDIHRITCRFSLHRSTKYENNAVGSPSGTFPELRASARTISSISCFSSAAYRFGTSPEFRMLFMSSRKASCWICVSLNRKIVGLPLSLKIHKYQSTSTLEYFFKIIMPIQIRIIL
jgi:hypothetical protein